MIELTTTGDASGSPVSAMSRRGPPITSPHHLVGRQLIARPARLLVAASLVVGMLTASGCAHQTGGVAPSNIPVAPNAYTILGDADGSDCAVYLLGLIPLSPGNSTADALDEALADRDGTDALINVTADTYSAYVILFSQVCTEVHGTAIRLR